MNQMALPWCDSALAGAEGREPDATTARVPQMVFVRHPRARRYVIRLTDRGMVRVTIPRWGSKREALAFASREHAWIDKQWQRFLRAARHDAREEQDGQEARERKERQEKQERQDRERAKRELPAILIGLAARLGFAAGAVKKISVRNQQWRWGSCSRSGHICLNWRLATMPDAVRDYVLIHELMHLKRMDHSVKFWKLVAQACPDYREHRRYLRSVSFRA